MGSRLLSRIPTCVPSRITAPLLAQFPKASSPFVTSTSGPIFSRTMSSSEAPRKFEWLVVIPDFPGVIEKRREVRPLHFAGLQPTLEAGLYQMGGAILNDVPKDDQPSSLDFCGSTLIAVAESREAVLEIIKKDVYVKEGVWDIKNVQMWPLKCAFRIPVPGQGQ